MIYSNRDSATKSTDPSRRARGIINESLHDSNSLRTGKISQWFHWQTHAQREVSKGEKNNNILKLPIIIANFQLLSLLIIETGACHTPLSLLLIRFHYLCLTTTFICPMAFFCLLYDSSITLPVLPRTDTEGNWTPPDEGANKKPVCRGRVGGREGGRSRVLPLPAEVTAEWECEHSTRDPFRAKSLKMCFSIPRHARDNPHALGIFKK